MTCEVRLSRYDPLLFLSRGVQHTERIILHSQPAANTFRYTGIRCVRHVPRNTSCLAQKIWVPYIPNCLKDEIYDTRYSLSGNKSHNAGNWLSGTSLLLLDSLGQNILVAQHRNSNR